MPNKITSEIRAAARALLESPEYQQSLAKRLREGKAPHMETLLHHYAYGKPAEVVKFGDDGDALPIRIVHEYAKAS